MATSSYLLVEGAGGGKGREGRKKNRQGGAGGGGRWFRRGARQHAAAQRDGSGVQGRKHAVPVLLQRQAYPQGRPRDDEGRRSAAGLLQDHARGCDRLARAV